jgi:hypothetical protein
MSRNTIIVFIYNVTLNFLDLNSTKFHQYFGGTYHNHLQSPRVSCLSLLLFSCLDYPDSEDGDMFLQNASTATNPHATVEVQLETVFYNGPCREVISGTK